MLDSVEAPPDEKAAKITCAALHGVSLACNGGGMAARQCKAFNLAIV